MMAKYFNAIKTKLHFLGVASIDRTIEKTKKKQKVGDDKVVGKVVDESRIITFRDNNFNIDSKSRFADIVEQIPLDADEFIKALSDAIEKELKKDSTAKGKSKDELKVEQDKAVEEKVSVKLDEKVDVGKNEELITEILTKLNSCDEETKAKVIAYAKENGISLADRESTPTVKFKEILAQF